MQTNRKSGMITMDDALFLLYSSGKISKENLIEYAQDQDAMILKTGDRASERE